MNIKHICILFGITAWANFATAASTPEDCAAITNDDKRLACYDQFLKGKKAPAKPEQAAQPEKPAKPAKPELPEQAQKPAPKPDVAAKKDKVEEFGQERIKKEETLDKINATALGEFTDWEKGLQIQLDNGQVWEITDLRPGYYKVTNPTVTIEKGFMGSYNMNVEGRNKSYRVIRIE
ncbi:early set domain-containing protein [Kangiella sp. M94]